MGQFPSNGHTGNDSTGLLEAIRRRRATFEDAARRAEIDRTLPAEVVELLRDLGAFWLKTPIALGGTELDPVSFCDVLEELAYYDASAAWSVMVGNGTTGIVAGWLPDSGIEEVFPEQEVLPIFAGQFAPRGKAVPVDGGYQVTGRWSFCSGIHHASWVTSGCTVADGSDDTIVIAVPKSDATVHDNWHVAGLQGTGSSDFSLSEVFVPARRTARWGSAPAQRGGPLFRQPTILFVANELSPVVVGIAMRAIDDMYEAARATARHLGGATLGERAAFQKDIGRCEARLRAVRVLYRDAVSRVWDITTNGEECGEAFVAAIRAQHTYVVEECLDLVGTIFRYAGGRALALDHPMQRHLRNLMAAMQHAYISDETYEIAGKARLADLIAE